LRRHSQDSRRSGKQNAQPCPKLGAAKEAIAPYSSLLWGRSRKAA
jgi:hypothetical protein